MRPSSTSRGRECLRPEVPRTRHASKRGTNVKDNRPFEAFGFAEHGVGSFGDQSATAMLARRRGAV